TPMDVTTITSAIRKNRICSNIRPPYAIVASSDDIALAIDTPDSRRLVVMLNAVKHLRDSSLRSE
ncbi:MAG: hypothetical protein NZ520_11530, partial [bacterium]|nr:hypothetical protein [bacterium]